MARIKVYDMEMEFTLAIGLRSINNFMNNMGFEGKTSFGELSITVTQTLPIIPDSEYIEKASDTIKKAYEKNHSDIEVLSCKFKGYKKLFEREVEAPEGEDVV